MQIKKHLLCTLFLNCPWVSCLHASSGTLNTLSYKLNFQRLFYDTIVKYNFIIENNSHKFKLVQKYKRGCVHSRKKHAVLGLNMANLLLSIKGILQSWSCRPNHLFNYFLGHCNPASAPVQFYCDFGKWRHPIRWIWREEQDFVWIRSKKFNDGGFAQIIQSSFQ